MLFTYLIFKAQIESWADCEQLISTAVREEKTPVPYKLLQKIWRRYKRGNLPRSDRKTRQEYVRRNCTSLLTNSFKVRAPTLEEKRLPIVYTIQVYRGAALIERLLAAVYMPHNIYCIHIDVNST